LNPELTFKGGRVSGACPLLFHASNGSIWNRRGLDLQGRQRMKSLAALLLKMKIWSDILGQDLIEYALISGFVAIAAGAIMPNVTSSVSKVFSRIASTMNAAAGAS